MKHISTPNTSYVNARHVSLTNKVIDNSTRVKRVDLFKSSSLYFFAEKITSTIYIIQQKAYKDLVVMEINLKKETMCLNKICKKIALET